MLEGLDLWVLARGLATHDGAKLGGFAQSVSVHTRWHGLSGLSDGQESHTRSILGNNTIDGGSLDTVDDVVAQAGHKMAITDDSYIALDDDLSAQDSERDEQIYVSFTLSANSSTKVS